MTWTAFLQLLAFNSIKPTDFKSRTGGQVTMVRSGVYCSTGAPCKYQKDQTWQPDKKKK